MNMGQDTRPAEPDLSVARHARYCIDPGQNTEEYTGWGWVRLEGPWAHIHDDEHGQWQSWPSSAVCWIEWETGRRFERARGWLAAQAARAQERTHTPPSAPAPGYESLPPGWRPDRTRHA